MAKQATAAQRALAAKGIGKITRSGAYRSQAKVLSDQMRNVRRNLEKAEATFKQASFNAPVGSHEAKRYASRAEYIHQQRMATYSIRQRKSGKKATASEISAAKRKLERFSDVANLPKNQQQLKNRERMAEVDWKSFISTVSRQTYSDIGKGLWTSGDFKGMTLDERNKLFEGILFEKMKAKGLIDDNASRADVIEAYTALYEFETGGTFELYSFQDNYADGGSPKDVGALSAFFA